MAAATIKRMPTVKIPELEKPAKASSLVKTPTEKLPSLRTGNTRRRVRPPIITASIGIFVEERQMKTQQMIAIVIHASRPIGILRLVAWIEE
jgi:hypothetical protein